MTIYDTAKRLKAALSDAHDALKELKAETTADFAREFRAEHPETNDLAFEARHNVQTMSLDTQLSHANTIVAGLKPYFEPPVVEEPIEPLPEDDKSEGPDAKKKEAAAA